jgi:hypothetical protein
MFREEEHEGSSSYETFITIYRTALHHIPEDSYLRSDCSEKLKSQLFSVVEDSAVKNDCR